MFGKAERLRRDCIPLATQIYASVISHLRSSQLTHSSRATRSIVRGKPNGGQYTLEIRACTTRQRFMKPSTKALLTSRVHGLHAVTLVIEPVVISPATIPALTRAGWPLS